MTGSPKLVSLQERKHYKIHVSLEVTILVLHRAWKKKSRDNPFLSLFSHSSKMGIRRNIIPSFVSISVQSGKQKLLKVFQQKGFNGAENSFLGWQKPWRSNQGHEAIQGLVGSLKRQEGVSPKPWDQSPQEQEQGQGYPCRSWTVERRLLDPERIRAFQRRETTQDRVREE